MRYFIGVPVEIDLKKYKDLFKAKNIAIKDIAINQHNHITMHFYGKLTELNQKKLIEDLSAFNFPIFKIKLNKVSYFKTKGLINVVYLGVDDEKIDELYQAIKKCLKFKDDRPFIPHITLCRNKSRMNNEFIIKQIEKIKIDEEVEVRSVVLYNSKLSKEGTIHEKVFVKYFLDK